MREVFGAVSARWRTLTEEQRVIWCAVARTKKSKVRLRQCGPLTGFLLFVKINVALANRGLAQVDLPPEYSEASQRIVASLLYTGKFDQPPVGPTLFLRANKPIAGWDKVRRQLVASGAAPRRLTPRQLTPSCHRPPWLPPGLSEVCPFASDFPVPQSNFSL